MLTFPQMPEQALTARNIQELGLGLGLKLDGDILSAETLRDSVEHIAHDPAYKAHVQEMQKHVRNASGYKKAVDVIQQFSSDHRMKIEQ
ncbi:hypothetical protein KDI_30050 [Dictyobacter arantiisoli]|uniref:Glycosyl transferase family 28 C-terminal domain-containing protein n=2 Tax=Dictyobacter arantiisoli TaxID=2014874 RepID=A0A5A5TD38_9CHLR|nr:hypothetical protein KDI_30050 [Dictyobacter arantiisoli]